VKLFVTCGKRIGIAMSKIGKKPIIISSAKVEIKDNLVSLSGAKGKLTHQCPDCLLVKLDDGKLVVSLVRATCKNNMLWGLHRALLANKVKGVEEGFELKLKIVGLGYKAQLAGRKLTFSLGYSHKIDYTLPDGVDVDVDKRTGQLLTFKSIDKCLLGKTCDIVRSFRKPEPYKGTGIIREG